MDHLDAMDDLKGSVGLNSYAQRDPLNEYRIQGADMFDEMIESIRRSTVRAVLSVVKREQKLQRTSVARITGAGLQGSDAKKAPSKPSPRVVKKVNPNEACPCGSGKKYKKCCGLSSES